MSNGSLDKGSLQPDRGRAMYLAQQPVPLTFDGAQGLALALQGIVLDLLRTSAQPSRGEPDIERTITVVQAPSGGPVAAPCAISGCALMSGDAVRSSTRQITEEMVEAVARKIDEFTQKGLVQPRLNGWKPWMGCARALVETACAQPAAVSATRPKFDLDALKVRGFKYLRYFNTRRKGSQWHYSATDPRPLSSTDIAPVDEFYTLVAFEDVQAMLDASTDGGNHG